VCATASTELLAAALGVINELADLLAGHVLTVVTTLPAVVPDGVVVTGAWSTRLGLPFALLDGSTGLLDSVVRVRGAEVLVFTSRSVDLDLPFGCAAELVARDGTRETFAFGSASEKALEKFKDALWALDEFAGVQLRDLGDPELLDISLRPHPGPLRRMLAGRLADQGASSVLDLRTWAVRHTVYRAADVLHALQAMLSAGDVNRSPATGRLAPTTMITPAHAA
jgi:hypothetical protein